MVKRGRKHKTRTLCITDCPNELFLKVNVMCIVLERNKKEYLMELLTKLCDKFEKEHPGVFDGVIE